MALDIEQLSREERFARLTDPLPMHAIEGRQDGAPKKDGERTYARFVLYVEAWYVAQRLDTFFGGDWSLDIEPLPAVVDSEGVPLLGVKGSLTVGGITREDVGQGRDWKQASTDALKRAAQRFGIGSELKLAEPFWVDLDGDSKYAKPIQNPALAYFRRYKSLPRVPEYKHADEAPPELPPGPKPVASNSPEQAYASEPSRRAGARPTAAPEATEPECPKCHGRMWDNRVGKRNPRAPDFKCRDGGCDGVIWPENEAKGPASARANGVDPAALEEHEPPY